VDWYKSVPKGYEKNLAYRLDLRERAQRDQGYQSAIIQACREDALFFFNILTWLYEPRPMEVDGILLPTQIPFITWEHQDPVIREIEANLGLRDIGIEKSRGQGASWIGVLLALRDWLFLPGAKVSLVSSTELRTDNPYDSDSLFWKLDWELVRLPGWMVGRRDTDWKRNLQNHTLTNLRNGSMITGYACTGDIARGGRARWFLMDELASWERGPDEDSMASTQQVSKCRLLVSTPAGTDGAYYRAMHEPSNMVKLILDWKDNPWQNRGLYRFAGRHMEAVSADNPLPPNYEKDSERMLARLRAKGFKLSKELRSPWYDNECDRTNSSPQSIAKELDRDYGGSVYRVLGPEFMEKAEVYVRPPYTTGFLNVHPETLDTDWEERPDGPMHLWTPLDARNRPALNHVYVIGSDLSSGLGGSFTSNSVLEVIDATEMEQVFEYATNSTPPTQMADLAIALANWFHGAYLIWEHNGPGAAFTERIKKQGYGNVFRRDVLWYKSRKKTKAIGWWTNEQTIERLFGDFRHAVAVGELKLRSKQLVTECGQWIRRGPQSSIVHQLAGSTKDESSRGRAHGDRVIAIGVCLQGVRDRPVASVKDEGKAGNTQEPAYGSFAWREAEAKKKQMRADDFWDDRCGTGDYEEQMEESAWSLKGA